MTRRERKGYHSFGAITAVQAVVKAVNAHALGAVVVDQARRLGDSARATAVRRSAIVLDRGISVLEAGQSTNQDRFLISNNIRHLEPKERQETQSNNKGNLR